MMSGADEVARNPEPEALPAPRPLIASAGKLEIGSGHDPADNGAPYIFIQLGPDVIARFYGERRGRHAELFVRALQFGLQPMLVLER